MKKEISELCCRIESMLDRKMRTPADFEILSEFIWVQVHENISSSTLMRMWGYAGKTAITRYSTKSILSRMLGYSDWDSFLAECSSKESNQSMSEIRAQKLNFGQMLEVCWEPMCRCVLRYEGSNQFGVMESENSYLYVGDSFQCGIFMLGEPLFLNNVIHNCLPPTTCIMGCKSGLTRLRLIE